MNHTNQTYQCWLLGSSHGKSTLLVVHEWPDWIWPLPLPTVAGSFAGTVHNWLCCAWGLWEGFSRQEDQRSVAHTTLAVLSGCLWSALCMGVRLSLLLRSVLEQLVATMWKEAVLTLHVSEENRELSSQTRQQAAWACMSIFVHIIHKFDVPILGGIGDVIFINFFWITGVEFIHLKSVNDKCCDIMCF